MAECSVSDCDRPVKTRGWCDMHYKRWHRTGATSLMERPGWPENLMRNLRFMPNGCIEFTGSVNREGYGRVQRGGRQMLAHRASYEMAHGPVPDGLELDHLCRNHPCVNPAHLEAVTPRVNQLRGTSFSAVNAQKTHCPAGHPYDEANTYVYPTTGWRKCRTCIRAYEARKANR